MESIAISRALATVLHGIALLATLGIAKFVYRGYHVRKSIRRLRAQGIVFFPNLNLI